MIAMTRLARFLLASAILVALLPAPASAITMNTGDVLVFNFDFTGQTPAPPYDNTVNADFQLAGVDVGDLASFEIFGDLNGTGGLVLGEPSDQLPLSVEGFFSIDANLQDGIFSIVVAAQQGPFDITDVVGFGNNNDQTTATITASVGRLAVPEPSSLWLMGAALLAGLGATRRRN